MAILDNKISGLQIVNYFDDIGCLLPASVEKMGLRTFRRFSTLIHFVLKDIKTKVGRNVAFLGLEGSFPDPSGGMLLFIDLTGEKKQGWEARICEFLANGRIPRNELDSLKGRMSFPLTSIFGMFGRAMMQPIYRKLYG